MDHPTLPVSLSAVLGSKKNNSKGLSSQTSLQSDNESEHAVPEENDSIKKPGLFGRFRSRPRKDKFRSVSNVGDGIEEAQNQQKKKGLFSFGSRSRSQPDLYRGKPPGLERESSKNVPTSLDIPGSPARRLKLGSKNEDVARLTPVAETPSENDDRRKASPDINPTQPIFKLSDAKTGTKEDDMHSTVNGISTEKSGWLKSAAVSFSFVQPRLNDTGGNRALPVIINKSNEQYGDECTDRTISGDLTASDGNIAQSELGDAPKKKNPPPLLRGQSTTRMQSWINSVTIFLFEGKDLPAMDRNGLSDPFCKFKLGSAKYKTRVAYKTLSPQWMEQFDLFIYDPEDKEIEITVWDWDRGMRNDYIGKAVIDLSSVETEKMCDMWLDIKNDVEHCGTLHLSILVSGKKLMTEKIPETLVQSNEMPGDSVVDRYKWQNTFSDVGDVGMVTVKVFRGCALRAADLNGKSDPYCILQLVNARLQTQVEPKTLEPEWNRVFTFPVNDIHSVLDITVLDMDQDKTSDFLGRVAVPLLKIHNGERRWYALKDQKLTGRAKGSILLEMELMYNPVRAALRTFNPKEVRFDEPEAKFKRQLFVRNVSRLRCTMLPVLEFGHFMQSCLNWESKQRSIAAFIIYLLVVYFFEIWMLPMGLLAIFLKYYVKQQIMQTTYAKDTRDDELADYLDDDNTADDDDDLDDDPNRTSAKTANLTLMTRVRVAQEQLRVVQNLMGFVGDMFERVSNTFQFTVPWISYMAMTMLLVASVILYFIPLRLMLLIWGINKFTKKLRKPNAASNNEMLDFLSRVYTNEEIKLYKEFRPRDVPNLAAASASTGVNASAPPIRRDGSRTRLSNN